MTDKVTLTNLSNLQNESTAVTAINNNNAAITTAIDNTLSRDGTSPNAMGGALDMNSNQIINLPLPTSNYEPLRVIDAATLNGGGTISVSTLPAGGLAGSVLEKASNTNYDATWTSPTGAWANYPVYNLKDFGAKMDGTTDDTAAINAAFATKKGSSALFLWPGQAKITGPIIVGDATGGASGLTTRIGIMGPSPDVAGILYDGPIAGVALQICKNKYFEISGISVVNRTYVIPGQGFLPPYPSSTTHIGIELAGAGTGAFGTQTLVGVLRNVIVNNFGTGIMAGGNFGAASEILYENLTLSSCTVGFTQIDFNSLDHSFINLNMSGNTVGLETSASENFTVVGGSASSNGVDFKIDSIGHIGVYSYRTEGSGNVFYGNNGTASSLYTTAGRFNDVLKTPIWAYNDATSSVWQAGAQYIGSTTGVSGPDPVPQARGRVGHTTGKYHFETDWSCDSLPATMGVGLASASHALTAELGSDNKSVAVFGGSVKGNGGVLLALPYTIQNHDIMVIEVDFDNMRLWVKNHTQGTTWNNNGAANPATNVGGIDISYLTNGPWYVAGELKTQLHSITLQSFNSEAISTGFTTSWTQGLAVYGAIGELNIQSTQINGEIILAGLPSKTYIVGNSLLPNATTSLPITISGVGQGGAVSRAVLRNNSNYTNPTPIVQDFQGVFMSYNNSGGLPALVAEPTIGLGTAGNVAQAGNYGPDYLTLSHVRQLSEAGMPGAFIAGNTFSTLAPGKNLRVSAKFAAAATAPLTFKRNVTCTSDGIVLTATAGIFFRSDAGKPIKVAGQGNNGQTDFYGYITDFIDTTHAHFLASYPQQNAIFGAPTVSVIGEDEPDSKYMIVGISGDAGETFWATALASSGFTLNSSNAGSTATVTALLVR